MKEAHPITEHIPQRPPFVLVDAIESIDEQRVCTRFTVREECVLVEEGRLHLSGLMENAAQTCAARAGWLQQQRGEAIKIGYIGAVKQMRATRLPRVGETLTTDAEVTEEVMNISLIECITRSGDEIIATTTLKLALTA